VIPQVKLYTPSSKQFECLRVGAARRHMAGLAALSRRLAGKIRAYPLVYTEIIRYLSQHERVEVIVNDALLEKRARKNSETSASFKR